jgi:4-amino-4-deoxy-L-arabinose transferase-like glycosyltransferase
LKFVRSLRDQSPGAVYQVLHYALAPWTHLHSRAMRVVNFVCLLLLLAVLFAMLRLTGTGQRNSAAMAFFLLAFPMTWVVGGLALTEVPAMLFAATAMWLLLGALRSVQVHPSSPQPFLLAAISGLMLSLAIASRSPFLVLLPASLALLLQMDRVRAHLLTIFWFVSLPIPLAQFWTWGGLVPPNVQILHSGYRLDFGVLALAYGAILAMIVAPSWFKSSRRESLLMLGVCLFTAAINVAYVQFSFVPMPLFQHLTPFLMNVIGLAVGSALLAAALVFAWISGRNILRMQGDPEQLFFAAAFFLLLSTCTKSSAQFSSRYVAQAAPVAILMLAPSFTTDGTAISRFVIGMLFGLLALAGYY